MRGASGTLGVAFVVIGDKAGCSRVALTCRPTNSGYAVGSRRQRNQEMRRGRLEFEMRQSQQKQMICIDLGEDQQLGSVQRVFWKGAHLSHSWSFGSRWMKMGSVKKSCSWYKGEVYSEVPRLSPGEAEGSDGEGSYGPKESELVNLGGPCEHN